MKRSLQQISNGIAHRIKLVDGNQIPLFGLGSWQLSPTQTYKSVQQAVKIGYRLFDTAELYENEQSVGQALQDSTLERHEYFVVTKLSPDQHGYGLAKKCLKTSLKQLKLDYVDLFLIHSPLSGKILETWQAICDLKRQGLTKSIGVSNFSINHLEGLMRDGGEKPVINQVEYHPWNQQIELRSFCQKHDITLMGFCPLARMKLFDTPKTNEIIDTIAEKYTKSRVQIILRWALQNSTVTIPRTSNLTRLHENAQLFDFQLTADEMVMISRLNLNKNISTAADVMTEDWKKLK